MNGILDTAIANLPAILSLFKNWHAQANPGTPPPTDEEVIAALKSACDSSIAKDDAWLAAHPE